MPSISPNSPKSEKANNNKAIHLVASDFLDAAHVWVGFAKPGPLATSELLAKGEGGNVVAVLKAAADIGVAMELPAMISDVVAGGQEATLIYLVESPTAATIVSWQHRLGETLNAWKFATVGLYLPPPTELTVDGDFLAEVLAALVMSTAVRTYALLVEGYGFNAALKSAHAVREWSSKHREQVTVFH